MELTIASYKATARPHQGGLSGMYCLTYIFTTTTTTAATTTTTTAATTTTTTSTTTTITTTTTTTTTSTTTIAGCQGHGEAAPGRASSKPWRRRAHLHPGHCPRLSE